MDANDIPGTVGGLYKYIITTMALVVSTLAGVNVWQYKDSVNVNKARLTERDVLNKTLSDVNATLAALSETSKRRNEVMDKLGELINQVSVALKMLTERLELQHEHSTKDLEKAIELTTTMADAVRVVAAEVKQGFTEVKSLL